MSALSMGASTQEALIDFDLYRSSILAGVQLTANSCTNKGGLAPLIFERRAYLFYHPMTSLFLPSL